MIARTGLALLVATIAAHGTMLGAEFTISVDVPCDLGTATFTANQTIDNQAGAYSLRFDGPAADLGPSANISALHLMEDGAFLLSTDAPFESEGVTYEARDVVRWDGASYSSYLEGEDLALPRQANIDALALLPDGTIALSFDAPVTLGTTTFLPADVAQVEALSLIPLFDGSAAGLGPGTDVVGYDRGESGEGYFVFGEPVFLPGLTVRPGTIVRRRDAQWELFREDAGFPRYAATSALSLPGSPGEATGLVVMKAPGSLDLDWQPTCSEENSDYAVHEGTLGDFASHVALTCSTGGDTSETVVAGDGNRYYLVVPLNETFEGSYGSASSGQARPPALTGCRSEQRIRPCP